MFLKLLILSAFCHSSAQILKPPEDGHVVFVGNSIMLSCYAPDIGDLTFQWVEYITSSFGNVLFEDSANDPYHMTIQDTKYDVTDRYDLYIDGVTLEDAGYYGCLLLETDDRYYTKVAVIEPLSLNIAGQRENETTAITCSTRYGYDGDFDLRIDLSLRIFQKRAGVVRMTFEGLASEGKVYNVYSSRRWILCANIYTSHNFTMSTTDKNNDVTCDVHAGWGEENDTFTYTESAKLKILVSPDRVSMFPRRDAYHVGDEVICRARGSPKLVFQWRQVLSSNNSQPIGRRLRMTRGMVGYNKWTCSVVNPYGSASADFVFVVLMVTGTSAETTSDYRKEGITEVETSPEAISLDVGVAISGRHGSIIAGLLTVFTLHG